MKNYILFLAIALLFISVLASFLNLTVVLIAILIACFLCVVLSANSYKNRHRIVLFLILLLFCVRTLNTVNRINTINENAARFVNLSVVVCNSQEEKDEQKTKVLTVKVLKSHNDLIKKGEKYLIYYNSVNTVDLGTKIEGEFQIIKVNKSFYSTGVYGGLRIGKETAFTENAIKFYSFIGRVHNFAKQTLYKYSRHSAVLMALCYGDRSMISDEFYNSVKICGVSHILVVSGLHFSVMLGAISLFLNAFKSKTAVKDIVFIALIFLYSAVCGFSPAVLRAGLVYVVLVIYKYLNRLKDNISLLSLAFVIIVFIHPFAVFDVSFQLSFAATLGILVIYPKLSQAIYYKFTNRPTVTAVLQNLSVSFSALVATFPIAVYHFGWVSLLALPVNLAVGFAANIMLLSTMCGLLFSAIKAEFLCKAAIFVSDAFADYFSKVITACAKLPYSVVNFKNTCLLVILVLACYLAVYELYTCKIRNYLVKLYGKVLKKEE